ncbi:MAG: 2-phospho-L-lactate guanylyltransferase [Actinomycetota bacterium]
MSERVVAVVPVKRLDRALMRLAGAIDAPGRRALQEAMLADVLHACAASPRLEATVVVTSDPDAAAIARAHAARVVPDHTPPKGIDAAVALGLDAADAEGAGAALVLFADLPLLTPADVAAVIDAAPAEPVTIAVSRDGTGTNALLMRPPSAMTPALGPGSLARHRDRAAHLGIALRTVDLPGLTLDVDTPDDLAAFLAAAHPCAALAACERLGLGRRITAGAC